jgi:hypothetical protein
MRLRRYRWWVLAGCLVVAGVVLAVWWLQLSASAVQVRRERYDLIRLGMTHDEVEAAMGGPPTTVDTGLTSSAARVIHAWPTRSVAGYGDRANLGPPHTLERWRGGDTVCVYFSGGRVVRTEYHVPVATSKATTSDWLRWIRRMVGL